MGVAGGHFGVSGALRGVFGDWNLLGVDLLGRYYFLDAPSSPFASVGVMPVVLAFTDREGSRPNGGDVTGTALSFELGGEFFRASTSVGVRLQARVDVPFFSLRDDAGQTHAFWVGSLVLGIAAKQDAFAHSNLWIL